MLNFLVGVGRESTDGGAATLTSSCTGNKGTKVKLGLRLVGVCSGAGMGDDGGVVSDARRFARADDDVFMLCTGGTGTDGDCNSSAGVAAVLVCFDDAESGTGHCAGVPIWDDSPDGERRGSKRIGTESRYGRISGSTAERESSRFFHFDGVSEGAVANRDMGNAGLDDDD